MDAASPELAKAWQLYFRQRGGEGPRLPPDIMPVVVLDTNTFGPFPPGRVWHAGMTVTEVAGSRSMVGILNADGAQPGGGVQGSQTINSRVVVDRITFVSTDPTLANPIDVTVRISHQNDEPFNHATLNGQRADDSEGEPQLFGANSQIGNVWVGPRAQAPPGFITQQVLPVRSVLPQILLGPFILKPQTILWIAQLVNVNRITAFFQGRYYGGS